MREGHVVVVLQAPTDRAITHTLLALLQLLQEAKVSGHNYTAVGHRHDLVFLRGAVFFFPPKVQRANAHRARGRVTRGAGAAVLTAARASHRTSAVIRRAAWPECVR